MGKTTPKKLQKKEVDELISRIAENDETLQSFEIPHQRISNSVLNNLLDAIETNFSLTKIDVSHNGLQDVGVCELFNRLMLSNSRAVRIIDVSNNGITINSGQKISEYLSYHFHIASIKYNDTVGVSVSESGLTTDKCFDRKAFTDRITQKIESKLASNRQMLRFLNEETNRFVCWKRNVNSLNNVLRDYWSDRIVGLDLTGNSIVEIPENAENYSVLEDFLFSHNILEKFPSFLLNLVYIRVIDVSYNKIKLLPEEMRSLFYLESLIVTSNEITHLPLFLGTLPSLSLFSAAKNPIDEYPTEILAVEDGGFMLLDLIRERIHQLIDASEELPYQLTPADRALIDNLREDKKKSAEFSILLPKKEYTHARKFVCRSLTPVCRSKPTAIQKIGDKIWCGMEDGSICQWDCRTFTSGDVIENALPGAILNILEISAISEVWVAGFCNSLKIFPSRGQGSFGYLDIFLDSQYTVVQSMIFVSISNRVWVASGNSILSYDAQNKTLVGTINMDSPVLSLLHHDEVVWCGCGDGCIYILKKNGNIIKTIQAASSMIFKLTAIGAYVWSSSNENIIKVWIKPGKKEIHCMTLVPVETSDLHLITSAANGETVYCQSEKVNEGTSFDILEFSPTGKLLNVLESSHKTFITAIAWSQSPDRLWTADESGLVCCHELKLGKKTMERIRTNSVEQPVAVSGDLKKAWRMSKLPTTSNTRSYFSKNS